MSLRIRFIVFLIGALHLMHALAADFDMPGTQPVGPMNGRQFFVDVGRPKARLRVTLFMPSNGGPFPLALINHGASHEPKRVPPVSDEFITYYFLSRGYAVALPMMRGYNDSDGHMPREVCDMVKEGNVAAADIRTVLDAVKNEPGIDASRIVVGGKSMGGWHTLAFGATQPSDVKGLVSFAGGVKESDCPTPDQALIAGSAEFGAKTRIKSIWFFGENDTIFSTPTWHAMFDAYRRAGAPSELVDIGRFQDDAHATFASAAGLSVWVGKLDAFLKGIGMPGTEVNADYMPSPPPPDTHYAALSDVHAVPYLPPAVAQSVLDQFLKAPLPRAMAVGISGASVTHGGFDAAQLALNDCERKTGHCALYAVDNAIVWPGEPDAPAPTHFARIDDVNAVPFLDAAGRAAYLDFTKRVRPRAFAIAPDGAWGSASGFDPITQALVQCGQGHDGCELYALDGDVVWRAKDAGKAAVAK
ncbi:alpha/beta hydrolase family protein [Pararobbsia silviterrae]|nr:alpha/beta hydrolase [Pararobbsia silviterrae]